jgi:hypothetical protein
MRAAQTWPTDWTPLATLPLAVPQTIAPGGKVVVGPFRWVPSFANSSVLMSASADGDTSTADTVAGPIANVRLVPIDNNVAQRRM